MCFVTLLNTGFYKKNKNKNKKWVTKTLKREYIGEY